MLLDDRPWSRIQRFHDVTHKPIHLLVAHTADAAAASLTLSTLLRFHLIYFETHPVGNYTEVTTIVQQMDSADNMNLLGGNTGDDEDANSQLFVLLGFGAAIDVSEYFTAPRHIVVILDAHRPVNLANLRNDNGNHVLVWGSQDIRREVEHFFTEENAQLTRKLRRKRRRRHENDLPYGRRSVERQRHGKRRTESSAATDQESGEGEGDGDGSVANSDVSDGDISELGSHHSQQYDSENNSESDASFRGDSDSEDEDYGDDYGSESYSMSQSQGDESAVDWFAEGDSNAPPVVKRLQRRYATLEYAGKSCALELYDLAISLQRQQHKFLWHAAVGVCDLFVRGLTDYATYILSMRKLHDTVTIQMSAPHNRFEDITNERTGSRDAKSGLTLENIDDPQLFLLRHFSLWDAIWNDTISASLLGLHHVEEGTNTLKLLLAECGVSVNMAKQPWHEILSDEREAALALVLKKLDKAAEKSGIVRRPYRIRTVARRVGYGALVSAFDACNVFNTLLAAAPTSQALPATRKEGSKEAKSADVSFLEFCRFQFWKAHRALDADPSTVEFRQALANAKALQVSVANATSALLQPGSIQTTPRIHYSQLSDPSKTTSAVENFWSPVRLLTLAQRLLYTLAMERPVDRLGRVVRPVLLTCAFPTEFSALADKDIGSTSAPHLGDRFEETLTVVVVYDRNTNGKPHSLPILRNIADVLDNADLENKPQRTDVRRNILRIQGRDNAIHFAEEVHLRSAKLFSAGAVF